MARIELPHRDRRDPRRSATGTVIEAFTRIVDNKSIVGFSNTLSSFFRAAFWEAVERVAASGDVRVVAISNPIIPGVPFYEAFTSDRERWKTITISAFETPNFKDITLEQHVSFRAGSARTPRSLRTSRARIFSAEAGYMTPFGSTAKSRPSGNRLSLRPFSLHCSGWLRRHLRLLVLWQRRHTLRPLLWTCQEPPHLPHWGSAPAIFMPR